MSTYPVLLFHSTEDRDLLSVRDLGNIRLELFEKLLVRLKKDFDIISLHELVRYISGNEKTKDRLLALTFDDGPKSYLTQALPVMEVHEVPSTCFLITDCVGDASLYWRYLYNYCIHKGFSHELAGFINDEYWADIRVDEIITFSRDHYDRTKSRCIIGKLLEKIITEEEYRKQEKNLFLSFEDIKTLKLNSLVSFGIHTRSHPVLKHMSDEEIREEIAGSLDYYRSRIEDEVPMLSIPFGRLYRDYDERAIAIAKNLSINVVLSAYGGGNAQGQPLHNIRRISVHEDKIEGGLDAFIKTLLEPVLPAGYLEKEKRLAELLSGRK